MGAQRRALTCLGRRCVVGLGLAAAAAGLQADGCPADTTIEAVRRGVEAGRLVASSVRVRGVVSARFPGEAALNGFFIQQSGKGGVPDGIFVYTPEHGRGEIPAAGSQVSVLGAAGVHRGQPQLEWVSAIEVCGSRPLQPIELELPLSPARRRALNGVLVAASDPLVVTANQALRRWGVLELAVGRRLFQDSSSVEGGQPAGFLLDDGSYATWPEAIAYTHRGHGRRVGSRLERAAGILVKRFGRWRLHPVTKPVFSVPNPRAQPRERDAGVLRIASFNLNNFFPVTAARGRHKGDQRRRHEASVIAALTALDADVLVVQELANNKGAAATLVERLNRETSARYELATGPASIGDDAIRVAILVRRQQGLALAEVEVLRDGPHNRPPVLARLRLGAGRRLDVAGVHFKSRGGCDSSDPCGEARRQAQARSLRRWVRTEDDVPSLVVGDFNSYQNERPLRLLRETGLAPGVAPRVPPAQRYSYVYRGRAGMMDFALMDRRARSLSSDGFIWHLGADEAMRPAANGPWGASDHDAVVVDIARRQPTD